jgi:hypothetical protein
MSITKPTQRKTQTVTIEIDTKIVEWADKQGYEFYKYGQTQPGDCVLARKLEKTNSYYIDTVPQIPSDRMLLDWRLHLRRKLTDKQRKILAAAERRVLECGNDGGLATSDAIEILHELEKSYGVHNPAAPTPRWVQQLPYHEHQTVLGEHPCPDCDDYGR